MLTRGEINTYRRNQDRMQRAEIGAAAWLIFYAVAVLGAIFASEVGTSTRDENISAAARQQRVGNSPPPSLLELPRASNPSHLESERESSD